MLIKATVENERGRHAVVLSTNGKSQPLAVASRDSGFGSAANGGELLCLALATCYCNDVYREAQQRSIDVVRVKVDAEAQFGAPGEPASRIAYRVHVAARAPEHDIEELILHTDTVAEVHNTLRRGMAVVLEAFDVQTIADERRAPRTS
jgi:organic hydroperoxide reductase OsmC/OhrA